MSYVFRAHPLRFGVFSGWSDAVDFRVWPFAANILIALVAASTVSALLLWGVSCLKRERQYSLRTLLFLMGFVSSIGAVFAHLTRLRNHEQEYVTQLEQMGWTVVIEEGQVVPEWLYRLLTDMHVPGRGVFNRVTCIVWESNGTNAYHSEDVNAVLRKASPTVGRLRYCVGVDINDPLLTDDGVIALFENAPNCEVIWIDGSTGITDRAIEHILFACPELKRLSIFGSSLSDAGLRLLSTRSQLEELDLCRSPNITPEGMMELIGLPTLINLTAPPRFYDDNFVHAAEERGISLTMMGGAE